MLILLMFMKWCKCANRGKHILCAMNRNRLWQIIFIDTGSYFVTTSLFYTILLLNIVSTIHTCSCGFRFESQWHMGGPRGQTVRIWADISLSHKKPLALHIWTCWATLSFWRKFWVSADLILCTNTKFSHINCVNVFIRWIIVFFLNVVKQ